MTIVAPSSTRCFNKSRCCFRVLFFFTFCVVSIASVRADWNGWRGDGSGVAKEVASPSNSEFPEYVWKTPVPGKGFSSPVISGARIFLTTAVDRVGNDARLRHRMTIAAAALGTGFVVFLGLIYAKRVRRKNVAVDPQFSRSQQTKRLRIGIQFVVISIVAGVAGIVAHQFARPDRQTVREVICVDFKTGAIRWRRECAAGPLLGSTRLTSAASATPVTDGRYVYCCFGSAGTYCLDFEGNIRWQRNDSVPDILYKAASSPLLWKNILILTYDTDYKSFTVAVDKATGAKRWEAIRPIDESGRRRRRDAYSTPILIAQDDRALLIHDSYRQLCCYDIETGMELWRIPTDAEQIVTSPVAADGTVVFAGECNHPIHLTAIDISGSNKSAAPTQLWQSKKQVPVMCSPVIFDQKIFSVSKTGILTCRELKTGKMLARLRLSGRFYASAIIVDGVLYLTNLDGSTVLLSADDELRELARMELGEAVYASLAVSRGYLILRGTQHLFCVRQPDQLSFGNTGDEN